MRAYTIQFHAMPEELTTFAEEITKTFNLHVTGIMFPPQELIPIHHGDLRKAVQDPRLDDLLFTLDPPNPAKTKMKFIDQNNDVLILSLGRLTDDGLGESCLSAAATIQPEATSTWEAAAKKLKSLTKPGATATDLQTGATSSLKQHRSTVGAREAQGRAIPMLSLSGPKGPRLTFPD